MWPLVALALLARYGYNELVASGDTTKYTEINLSFTPSLFPQG